MKALVYVAPERMELRRLPDPELREGDALLRVSAAGICGSDIHGFLGHSERRGPGLVMGHEAVATIAEVHPGVSGWRAGQRVSFNPLVSCGACPACLEGRQNVCERWRVFGMDDLHGTYAELVAVPARQLRALPESLPEEEAILVEPMAVVVHAFRIARAEPLGALVVVGAGPIGSLALALARLRGFAQVLVIDVNAARLEAARRLGADAVIDASREDAVDAVLSRTGGVGARLVIEAVGSERTRRTAAGVAARGATLLLLGLAENETAVPWIEITRKELALVTSFAYTPLDFEASARLVEQRAFDLKPWTEALPLEDGHAGFAKMARDPGATLKMMLKV
jgi:threonine dehydrogenase-like Zn-dependent dehydrogenase